MPTDDGDRLTIKIEALVGETTTPLDHGNALMRESIAGRERLRVGVRQDQDRYVLELAAALVGRCRILYVLHTTRTGAQLGRYESPEMELEDIRRFFQRLGRYFSEDSRHDRSLWRKVRLSGNPTKFKHEQD